MRHCLSLVLSLTCLIRTEATKFESGVNLADDIEATAQLTERVRQPLVAAIRREFRPVSHNLHLKPE